MHVNDRSFTGCMHTCTTQKHIQTGAHTHERKHAKSHAGMRIGMQASLDANRHAWRHAYMQTCMHSCSARGRAGGIPGLWRYIKICLETWRHWLTDIARKVYGKIDICSLECTSAVLMVPEANTDSVCHKRCLFFGVCWILTYRVGAIV